MSEEKTLDEMRRIDTLKITRELEDYNRQFKAGDNYIVNADEEYVQNLTSGENGFGNIVTATEMTKLACVALSISGNIREDMSGLSSDMSIDRTPYGSDRTTAAQIIFEEVAKDDKLRDEYLSVPGNALYKEKNMALLMNRALLDPKAGKGTTTAEHATVLEHNLAIMMFETHPLQLSRYPSFSLLARIETKNALQDAYMKASLMRASGDDRDIFELMKDVSTNTDSRANPMSKEEFHKKYHEQVPEYMLAGALRRQDGEKKDLTGYMYDINRDENKSAVLSELKDLYSKNRNSLSQEDISQALEKIKSIDKDREEIRELRHNINRIFANVSGKAMDQIGPVYDYLKDMSKAELEGVVARAKGGKAKGEYKKFKEYKKEQEKKAKEAKKAEKKATKKVPFWKKWFGKKKEDNVDTNNQESVKKPKLTRERLEKLQGLTPDRVPYKAEKRENDPNKWRYLYNNNNEGR
jgi:hypothetical protein